MSKAARTMLVFGIYLVGLGLILLIVPNTLRVLFGFPPTDEPWIRVVGFLVLLLALYYVNAAQEELTPFFRWTVYGRAAVILVFTAFVLLGLARWTLIVFGAADLLGALWTGWALRTAER